MAEETNPRIDPNTADAGMLTRLPGIGPELALRIQAARPFETQDDLRRVSGIGPTVLARLRPFLALPPGSSEPEMAGEPGIAWEAKAPPVVAVESLPEPAMEEAAPPEPAVPEASQEEDIPAEVAAFDTGEMAEKEASLEAPSPEPEIWEEPAEELWVETGPAPVSPPVGESAAAVAAEELWGESEPTPASPPIEDSTAAVGAAAAESAPPEVEPVVATEKVAPLPTSKPQPALVTRGQAFWMVAAGSVLTLLIALVLSLGILAAVNRGQLQFVTPAELAAMSGRVDGLESRADTLNKDVAGLRARLDNLEALSGRVSAVEETIQSLRSDLDATSARVESLDKQASDLQTQLDGATKRADALEAQAKDLDARMKAVQTQVDRFQAFLVGLRDLLDAAFQEQEVVK
jgi:chaperonin cofactor prefoldin